MKLYMGWGCTLVLYVYVPLALIGLCILFRKIKPWKTRLWAVPLYVLVAYAIPLGDVTWHSWNMAKVCPKAGLHIYRSVMVDGFYCLYGGMSYIKKKYSFVEQPESPGRSGYIRINRTGDKFNITHNAHSLISEFEFVHDICMKVDKKLGVVVNRWVVRNIRTGEVIAESLSYSAIYGWIDAIINDTLYSSPGSCYKLPKMNKKIHEILIPSGGKNE